MEFKDVECKLVDIKQVENGSSIILHRKDNIEMVTINVDENVSRVINRIKEQYDCTDGREGVYLSRGMTNIDISTVSDKWYIHEGDVNYYIFDKDDVVSIIERH